jgi:cyclopropane fatty-acyl-phospholipid synthase-like methyltransferase
MTEGWDGAYTGAWPAAWDIGRPQPEFVRLAEAGLLTGQVLDVGCGTGEHAILAAAHGADALGVDIAPTAIERARAKAAQRHSPARFEVGNVLDLPALNVTADTVIDSGVFHVFSDDERPQYVTSLAAVTRPGGVVRLMCFSERQPGDFGPRRVTQAELRDAFSDGWRVESIDAAEFEVKRIEGSTEAHAWLAAISRGSGG